VFAGEARSPAAARARESGSLMVVPLVLLSLLSLVGGALNLPGIHSLADFLDHHAAEFDRNVAMASTAVAVLGILLAWAVYSRGRIYAEAPDRLAHLPFRLFTHMKRKWYWDELYSLIAVRPYYWIAEKLAVTVDWRFWHDFVHDSVLAEPLKATAAFLANPVDLGIVDGLANELADVVQRGSRELRKVQTGYVRNYALSVLLGVTALVAWLVSR
jgi:NADH-quinone oxidoreductase subunit L